MNNQVETITEYVISSWYESKCKKKEDIINIVKRELEKHPTMETRKLKLHIKRCCMSEL